MNVTFAFSPGFASAFRKPDRNTSGNKKPFNTNGDIFVKSANTPGTTGLLLSPGLSFAGKNKPEENKEKLYIESDNFCFVPAKPYEIPQGADRTMKILDTLRYENPQKKYIIEHQDGKFSEDIRKNAEAQEFAKVLDELCADEKKDFINAFCKETGFPNLNAVFQKMEGEITGAIHQLADENDFDVKFIGYDKNCSMGRNVAYPGSDCDALFMIIDTSKHEESWFAGAMRWQFKDLVNQRILCTPAGGLPEVLSTDFIEEGLELADTAYKKAGFKSSDFNRFEANLKDDSKDFVKAAEFNIRLAERLPSDTETRDKFYKTAMFVELVRYGKIVENNFDAEFVNRIKKSPLYRYSNILRQEGFSSLPKEKHTKRIQVAKNFYTMNTSEQFALIRDMIRFSLYIKDAGNEDLFANVNSNGEDEMGNILEMYDMLQHKSVDK